MPRQLVLINCTFSANSAATSGGGMFAFQSSPALINCILWGNSDEGGMDESAQIHVDRSSPVVSYSIIQGLNTFAGNGNIGNDPLFVDPDGADEIAGTQDDDLRVQSGSPAIDAGDNTAVPADIADLDNDGDTTERTPLDLNGNPRFVDDLDTPDCQQAPGTCGTPPIVDMGAFEHGTPFLGACCNTRFGTCTVIILADCTGANLNWVRGDFCNDQSCPDPFIPTISQWGLVILTLLLLITAKIYFGRRQPART